MEIINESNLPLEFLKLAVIFCKPWGITVKKIIFRNSKKSYYGYCLVQSSEIVVGIGTHAFYPLLVNRAKDKIALGYASGFMLNSRKEAIVYLISHEMYHILQKKLDKEYLESTADRYALRKLEKWRKSQRGLS